MKTLFSFWQVALCAEFYSLNGISIMELVMPRSGDLLRSRWPEYLKEHLKLQNTCTSPRDLVRR